MTETETKSQPEPESPETASELTAPSKETPQRKWYQFWRKGENIDEEQKKFIEETEEEAAKFSPVRKLNKYREIIERGPGSAEEVVDIVNNLSFSEIHRLEKEDKFGTGIVGKFRAYLSGENDFSIDKDDKVRHNSWNELTRRGLQIVFNRRTIAAGGMAAVLGVLTGGVGAAAGGVIFGSMAGRGTAEAIGSITGKERGARKDILIAEKERWNELKKLADELKETSDTTRCGEILTQITDLYFKQGESVVLQQLRFAEDKFKTEQQAQNKLRARLQTIGEIAGLGAGIAHGFLTGHFASIDIDLWNKVKGQSLMHEVVKVDNAWHFVWNEAGKAGTHALGEPAWKIGVATFAERGLPVLLAAWSAHALGKKAEASSAAKKTEYAAQKTELQKRKVLETIPKAPSPPTESEQKAKWQSEINRMGFGVLPERGQKWYLRQEKEGKTIPKGKIEVTNVDWQNERVYFKSRWKLHEGGYGWHFENLPIKEFLHKYLYIEMEEETAPEKPAPEEETTEKSY